MKTILQVAGMCLAFFWLVVTFADYWQYHDLQREAWQKFQFGALALSIFLVSTGAAYLAIIRRKKVKPYVNGLLIFLLSLVLLIASVQAFSRLNMGSAMPPHQVIQFLISNTATALAVLLVIATAFSVGNVVLQIGAYERRAPSGNLLSTGLGIIILTAWLFLLGLFNLLLPAVVWGSLVALIALTWRRFVYFLLMLLWKPIGLFSRLNVVGIVAFIFLLWWLNLNLVYTNRPFPLGFDAMAVYVNLASLIHDYNGLVSGFGMYNWSIFSSLGYVLFDETAVTLCISLGGGVLALAALFTFARRWVDPNLAMVITLVFYSLPMINWLSYKDIKVDMPLLFFTILSLIVFMEWLTPKRGEGEEPAPVKRKKRKKKKKNALTRWMKRLKKPAPAVVRMREGLKARLPRAWKGSAPVLIIGVLSGFSIGVKLTAILMVAVFCCAIMYRRLGYAGFLSTASLAMGLFLLAKLDSRAGLRYYNLSAELVQWGLIGIGVVTAVILVLRQSEEAWRGIRQSMLLVVVSVVMILPWLGKNMLESGRTSTNYLLQGQRSSPKMDMDAIGRIYESLEESPSE